MAATGRDSNRGSIVSGSSVIAAGLASALAAAVTSSMGWAGGLIGAALTTMIITGGSAILNAYLQSAKSRVQAAPGNIRAAAQRVKTQSRVDAKPPTVRPEDGLVNRLRRALGWFSRLPFQQRRSILKRGLIGAGIAFVIGIISITALEYGIGNSLSCGIWGNCSATSAPGFNGGNAYAPSGAGSGYSILAGRSAGGGVQQAPQQVPQQGGGGLFGGGGQQAPQQPAQPQGGGGGFFGGGNQQAPQQPAQPAPQQPAQPAPQQPAQPAPQQPAQPPQQPVPAEPVQPQTPQ